jgi:hypothetical protein
MSAFAIRRGVLSLGFWLGAAAFAVAMTLLVTAIVHTLKHVKPVRSSVPPVSAVVWGDRVFLTRAPLRTWLQLHGTRYGVWARRHRVADHLLGRPAPRK